jgi:hypothetical protein
MPLHTNDFANAMGGMATPPKSQGMEYHGVDIGAYIDYAAINQIVQAAIAKMPAGAVPGNAGSWTATVVLHPGDGEGAAWIMEHNPLITWAGFKLRELLGLPESLFATA